MGLEPVWSLRELSTKGLFAELCSSLPSVLAMVIAEEAAKRPSSSSATAAGTTDEAQELTC